MTERYDLIVKDRIVAVFEMLNTSPSTLSTETLDYKLARAKGREAVTGLMMQASTATNRSHTPVATPMTNSTTPPILQISPVSLTATISVHAASTL